jgi:hypothetical protein
MDIIPVQFVVHLRHAHAHLPLFQGLHSSEVSIKQLHNRSSNQRRISCSNVISQHARKHICIEIHLGHILDKTTTQVSPDLPRPTPLRQMS